VGIGTKIAGLGAGGALLTMALGMMTGRSDGSENSMNPLNMIKDWAGEDSTLSKLMNSGTGPGIAAFIGALLMPKAFGPVKGMAMSLAGLYTAYGLYKNTLSGDFNGLPGQIAGLDIGLSSDENTVKLTSAEDAIANLQNLDTAALTSPTPEQLANATRVAENLNSGHADPRQLTAAGSGKFGLIAPEDIGQELDLDPAALDGPDLVNE